MQIVHIVPLKKKKVGFREVVFYLYNFYRFPAVFEK